MLLGPLLVRYNGRIADRILRRPPAQPSDVALETAATREIARREHVIICGFGRVGQNLARVLERRGFEFIALDFDPFRVRDARMAGEPVVYGDATHPEVLRALGLEHASVVVISFDEPETAVRIVRAVRRLRDGRAGARAHRGRQVPRAAAGGRRDRSRARHLRDEPRARLARAAVPARAADRGARDDGADPPRALRDPAQRVPAARAAHRSTRGRPAATGSSSTRSCCRRARAGSARPSASWAWNAAASR